MFTCHLYTLSVFHFYDHLSVDQVSGHAMVFCAHKHLHSPFIRVKFMSAGEESRIFYYGFNLKEQMCRIELFIFTFNSPIDLHFDINQQTICLVQLLFLWLFIRKLWVRAWVGMTHNCDNCLFVKPATDLD